MICIARAWVVLMKRLGYTQFVAQGGDWGALIVDMMGVQAPGIDEHWIYQKFYSEYHKHFMSQFLTFTTSAAILIVRMGQSQSMQE